MKFSILILLLIFLTACSSSKQTENTDKITEVIETPTPTPEATAPEGTSFLGTSFSGQTKNEVQKTLNSIEENIRKNAIQLNGKNEPHTISFADVNLTFEENSAESIMNGEPPTLIHDEKALNDIVYEIKVKENIEPINATVKKENGAFMPIAGSYGSRIDEELLFTQLREILSTGDASNIDFSYVDVEPKYKKAHMEAIQDKLGEATTKYSGESSGRTQNLKLATSNTNGFVLYPGDTFSTNRVFKSRTVANGYVAAPGIVDGELVDGIGGGICQVSSTMYDAVLESELKIEERTNHSLKVGYLPYAFDSTLVDGAIDFKFSNNTVHPIYIEATAGNGRSTIAIYGKETRPANRTIKFYNKHISTKATTTENVEDPTLPQGKTSYKTRPLDGQTYELYKDVFIDGQLAETQLINKSVYRARKGIMLVGTGPAAPAEEAPVEEIPVEEIPVDEAGEAPTEPTTPKETEGNTQPAETEKPIEATPKPKPEPQPTEVVPEPEPPAPPVAEQPATEEQNIVTENGEVLIVD
ncbi:MAG: VanW family protein [Lachnospirales bacterium]